MLSAATNATILLTEMIVFYDSTDTDFDLNCRLRHCVILGILAAHDTHFSLVQF